MYAVRHWSIGFLAVALVAIGRPAVAASANHVVIAEVLVGGESARDEFVELYNPTDAAIPLEGWRLSRRTASGIESNLVTVFPVLSIAPHASVLIAPSESVFAAQTDVPYSTQSSLAANNTVVLYGTEVDGVRPVVDLVGFGSATGVEGAAALDPAPGTSLERRPGGASGNGEDTDNNAADFVVQTTPTPQPASAAARPPIDTTTAPTTSGTSATTTTPPTTATNADTTGTTTTGTTTTTTDATSTATSTQTTTTTTSAPLTEPSRASSGAPPVTHVRINEFVADPAEGEEWIELANVGPNPVNLADWTINDGAETMTTLSGALPVGGFFVVTNPRGKLNNAGDRLALRNPHGNLVDAVTYGDWDDGRSSDNAPVASDPASIARVVDGQDTDNDRLDFVRTEVPTRGGANLITGDVATTSVAAGSAQSATLRIPQVMVNELLPNPSEAPEAEWIELANLGTERAALGGWRLRDALGAEYVFPENVGVAGGAFLVLPRAETGIALNNTGGETIELLRPGSETAVSRATYRGAAAIGVAWTRGSDGQWRWTEQPTPGAVNVVAVPNRAPDAVIDAPGVAAVDAVVTFDGSDSADADREPLRYFWEFGDATTEADVATTPVARYVYAAPGTYTVTFTVTDARGAIATARHRMRVVDREGSPPAAQGEFEGVPPPVSSVPPITNAAAPVVSAVAPTPFSTTLRLSELLPNPTGSDSAEWIEVENYGAAAVDLQGWTITVIGTAPRSKAFSGDRAVPARGFLLLPRDAYGLALRNDAATVELRAPDGRAVDRVSYENAREGASFSRTRAGQWGWTTPTPGAANATVTLASGRVSSAARRSHRGSQRIAASASSILPSLDVLDDLDPGESVRIRGTVTAAPQRVGKQVLYIGDASGGVQVFFGTRAIPSLEEGTTVEVAGEIRSIAGEPRVGIRTADDIRVVTTSGTPRTPAPFRIAEATSDRLGELVFIEGEVVERRGSILQVDDGSDEIRIALPTGAEHDPPIASGDVVRAAGILSMTKSGYRILARHAADVEAVERASVAAPQDAAPGPIPAATELAVLGGGGSALLASSAWRRRRLFALAGRGVLAGARRIIRRA